MGRRRCGRASRRPAARTHSTRPKRMRASERTWPPVPASLPKKQRLKSLHLPCCTARQPSGRRGGAPVVQFPECSLPFLGGHHSLVMFTLMSYMLISYGPSPPLQMGLWGDIPSHPLVGDLRIMPREQAAPPPASGVALWKWPYGGHFRLFPAAFHPWKPRLPAQSFVSLSWEGLLREQVPVQTNSCKF